MTGQLYKIVAPDGAPIHGGYGHWPLPTDTEPGAWRSVEGEIVACRNGLHVTDAEHLSRWLPSGEPYAVYPVETRGPIIDARDKFVVGEARLLPRPAGMPDVAAIRQRAQDRMTRAIKRHIWAVKAAGPWGAYAEAAGIVKFPPEHPATAALAKIATANAARQREVDRANREMARAMSGLLAAVR